MAKVRKRGKRGPKPPKSVRDANKRAALALAAEDVGSPVGRDASLGPATQEDDILPSVETGPVTGPAIEEEEDLLSEQDGARRILTRSVSPRGDDAARLSSVIDLTVDEANMGEEEESEVSWSRSPSKAPSSHPSNLPLEELDETVQPTGDYCLVICRVSSQKQQADPTGKKSATQKWQDYRQRRVDEGYTMADRLADNCPTPVQFREVESYCGVCHSDTALDWFKRETSASDWVKSIRGWFRNHADSHVTVLIRSVDGLTTHPPTLQSFLEMVDSFGVTAQLIFQWNKVCDEIRPVTLTPFLGLGSLAEFSSQDVLDHQNDKTFLPEVERLLDVLIFVGKNKLLQQGNQDRNGIMESDAEHAEEVESMASSAGRRGKRMG